MRLERGLWDARRSIGRRWGRTCEGGNRYEVHNQHTAGTMRVVGLTRLPVEAERERSARLKGRGPTCGNGLGGGGVWRLSLLASERGSSRLQIIDALHHMSVARVAELITEGSEGSATRHSGPHTLRDLHARLSTLATYKLSHSPCPQCSGE